jgi:WD40 repeat protein
LDKTIWVWDINRGKRLRVLEGHKGEVTSLCALEKGFLASASDSEKTVRVWDIKSGKCVRVLQENMLGFSIISLSYLGKGRLASASRHTVRVWDLNATETTPKLLKLIFPIVYGAIRSIQAIPDTNKILILRVPNEYKDPVLNDSFINICDITNLENFPKPNRSAIGHRIQNWLRKKGGRVSRKKRIINKNRNTKKFRG